jgi:hypothetical protein
MAFPVEFKNKDFLQIIKLLQKRNLEVESINLIKLSENIYSTYFKNPIKITSLTENEITFISEIELPEHGILHINNESFSVLATIAPSYFELSTPRVGFHYMALLNCMLEKDRQNFRQVTRAFSKELPETWDGIDIELDKLVVKIVEEEIEKET